MVASDHDSPPPSTPAPPEPAPSPEPAPGTYWTCLECRSRYAGRPHRCAVCGAGNFSGDGRTAAARAVLEQTCSAVIVGVRLDEPPWGALGLTGPCYLLVVLGSTGADWAAYAAPAAWIDGVEDADAALAQAAERGTKLPMLEAVNLFPFMNPNTYRD